MADAITLITEPHVDSLIRANLYHVRGSEADLVVDAGTGIAPLAWVLGGLIGAGQRVHPPWPVLLIDGDEHAIAETDVIHADADHRTPSMAAKLSRSVMRAVVLSLQSCVRIAKVPERVAERRRARGFQDEWRTRAQGPSDLRARPCHRGPVCGSR